MSPFKPLYFREARELVLSTVRRSLRARQSEMVDLAVAHGRVLAEPIRADRDYPAVDRSVRDGFALRAADALSGPLRLAGEVRAGVQADAVLQPGEAIEIMTGAPLPAAADAVLMVEHAVRLDDGRLQPQQPVAPGQFINRRGAEAAAESILLSAGIKLDASHVATLAMTGHTQVAVCVKPRVAIVATGDELVAVGQQPAPHQIRNSNSHMLAALVAEAGGSPEIFAVAPDTMQGLLTLFETALTYDLLLVSGGVSAGKYDLVKPALRSLGAEFLFERVRIQPGQPTAFGVRGECIVFGLPGNPASSLVTFQLFATAALELLAGATEPLLPLLQARLAKPFQHKLGLTRFLPACLDGSGESLEHIGWQGSSDIPALARANVFLVAEHDRELWAVGDTIRVMRKP